MTPNEFVAKWRDAELKERSAYQEHFIDLCHLLGHPTPVEADKTGASFTFEAFADKTHGGSGFADVWKKEFFAWEYKGKHANLDKAYQQLLQYREALLNPPLLVVCDINRIVVHTNFTNTAKQTIEISLDALLTPRGRELLRAIFYEPFQFKSPQTTAQVTEHAAREFGKLAEQLRKDGLDAHAAAHFLIRILFCLFAEDVGLLPDKIFSQLVKRKWNQAGDLTKQLSELFRAMKTGGVFYVVDILRFNGGLFDDDSAYDLDGDALKILQRAAELDWSVIEPSIFGTLFERSLDPAKRSQIGAHYTSRADIELVVEPVLMQPLRRRWDEIQNEARTLAAQRDAASGKKRAQLDKQIQTLLMRFTAEIARVQVLDPACGSGNFLYVALKALLDLEKSVIAFMRELRVQPAFPTVHPSQLHGIEINAYAYELAQATVWIGYIQWLHENGYGFPPEPILQPLNNFRNMDAILDLTPAPSPDRRGEKGERSREPAWQRADIIIGNPPFLGGNKIREGLGDEYVNALFALYRDRVPAFADLVCYWFEKARAMIASGQTKRAGLLATQAIRGGVNRKVLERIKESGDIFWAQSDRNWILDGAAVRVSMVGFDDGAEKTKEWNGQQVAEINPNLSSSVNLLTAKKLKENLDIAFYGSQQKGSFDITKAQAMEMLTKPNPNRKSNRDVIKKSLNGEQVLRGGEETWVIDFGVKTTMEEAALYEAPFEYVKKIVYQERKNRKEKIQRDYWWLHARPSPRYREILKKQNRYIATPALAKHRIFVWLTQDILADHAIVVFARDDDYFFGVLHSRIHEIWALKQGTALTDRPRYTPTTTFETFPFPFPPGQENQDDARVVAIADAARALVQLRDNWLNPSDASDADLKKRTLTNLYNQNPQWLQNAHRKLDDAVLDAYGWDKHLSDDGILEKLLALNLERAQ